MEIKDWYWYGPGIVRFRDKKYFRGDKISPEGIPEATWKNWKKKGKIGGPIPQPKRKDNKLDELKKKIAELEKKNKALDELSNARRRRAEELHDDFDKCVYIRDDLQKQLDELKKKKK